VTTAAANPPQGPLRPGGSGAAGIGAAPFGPAATVPIQSRIVGENRAVQVLQRLPWVDAKLPGEQVADPPVGGQRIGLPARPVQPQHELAVQPFPQRMLAGQPLQFSGQRLVAAQRQVGFEASSTAASRNSSRRTASGRTNV
jgi:hypothetical protein